MSDKYTREQLEQISPQHLNALHAKHCDEIRHLRKQLETLEENIILMKLIRNERKGEK